MLLLVGSGTTLVGGTYQAGGTWKTTSLGDATDFGTSLTVDSSGRGIGLYTSTTLGDVGYTVWSGNAWSTAADVGLGITSRAQPFLDATGGSTTYAVYQAPTTYDYWSLTFSGSTWSSALAVGPVGNQYFGPVPPTVAALGADATAAFIDNHAASNWAASADLVAGAWDTPTDITGPENAITPSIIALSGSGPELMMTFVAYNGTQIYFLTQTAGTWNTAAAIASCFTGDRVALAPLPGGDAMLAFQGTDGNLYWSEYSGGAWSAVLAFTYGVGDASPGTVPVDTTPAVTHGIGTDVAEIAYLSGGVAYSASLTGTTWGTPVSVGLTGLSAVAIAASP